MKDAKFKNGDLLKDKVTGLDGIVMVVAYYATGCIHYGIQPQKVKDDCNIPDWQWFDESRMELVKEEVVSFSITVGRNSGPMPKGPQV